MDAIFVVVDRFSKLAKFTPTQINTMATGTTKLFFDMWVQHNGMLKVIVNDWDVQFKSEFSILLMEKTDTKLKFSIIFHLQIDGQIKKVNEILNQYLCIYIVDNHKD